MKTDCFYVYNGFPVAIEKLLPDDKAEVRYVERVTPERKETVSCSDLTELTEEMAVSRINKLCKLRDQAAGKYKCRQCHCPRCEQQRQWQNGFDTGIIVGAIIAAASTFLFFMCFWRH